MIAEGLSYPKAVELIETLKAHNIEANITVGGISLSPRIDQVGLIKRLCKEVGALVIEGNATLLEEMITTGINQKKLK